MFNPKQPGGLWDGELKPRHFVEFTPDSIDKCSRVHHVGSLGRCVEWSRRIGSILNQSKTHAARFPTSRPRNAPRFQRFTRSSCEVPTNIRVPPLNIRDNIVLRAGARACLAEAPEARRRGHE